MIGRHICFQCPIDIFRTDTKKQSYSNSSQSILKIIGTGQFGSNLVTYLISLPCKTQKRISHCICGNNISILTIAKSHRAGTYNRAQNLIIPVKKGLTFIGCQEIIKLSLCFLNTLKRPKTFKVSLPDIGNQSIIGSCQFTQKLNLTRVIGSHLKNQQVCILRHCQDG